MSPSAADSPPPSLPFDRDVLLHANREAISTGRDLLSWWLEARRELLTKCFPLGPAGGSLVSMDAFYSELGPGLPTVMGCLQSARFPVRQSLEAGISFVRDLPRTFGSHCWWIGKDGARGGFTYTPVLVQRSGAGEPDVPESGGVDFRLGGLDWQILRVDIHDFVRGVPMMAPFARPMRSRIREAALIVTIPELSKPLIPGNEEAVAEVAFGYTFLPLAPEPNVFGFGPGHFQSAVKQFHVLLFPDRSLEIRLAFLVSPRSQRILNLRGFDPVYSAVTAVDRLTLGRLGLSGRFHDRMDALMLRIHGQVHQNLLEEMAPFWTAAAAG